MFHEQAFVEGVQKSKRITLCSHVVLLFPGGQKGNDLQDGCLQASNKPYRVPINSLRKSIIYSIPTRLLVSFFLLFLLLPWHFVKSIQSVSCEESISKEKELFCFIAFYPSNICRVYWWLNIFYVKIYICNLSLSGNYAYLLKFQYRFE